MRSPGQFERPRDGGAVGVADARETAPMRMAAVRHDVGDLDPGRMRPRLREHRHGLGELLRREGRGIASLVAADAHAPRLDAVQAGERTQDGRLAAAVRPDEGGDPSGCQAQRDVVHHPGSAVSEHEGFALQGVGRCRRHISPAWRRRVASSP